MTVRAKRFRGNLSQDDIAKLRKCFDADLSTFRAGIEVDCSKYTAAKYFRKWRGRSLTMTEAGKRRKVKRPAPAASEPKQPIRARFYTSNFEL